MKKFYAVVCSLYIFAAASAQTQNPVSWAYTAVKKADKTYEVHFKATINAGWHLFSQTQPEDAIGNPTEFKISPNPLIEIVGKLKEMGKMEKFHDANLGVSANQYAGSVDFVQTVKLKANAKTNISGYLEFQTCNDKTCLPPKKVNFSVAIK